MYLLPTSLTIEKRYVGDTSSALYSMRLTLVQPIFATKNLVILKLRNLTKKALPAMIFSPSPKILNIISSDMYRYVLWNGMARRHLLRIEVRLDAIPHCPRLVLCSLAAIIAQERRAPGAHLTRGSRSLDAPSDGTPRRGDEILGWKWVLVCWWISHVGNSFPIYFVDYCVTLGSIQQFNML